MLNMIDTQDKLKNFSEQQLIQEMQQPSGSAPQFMVLGEIERRKRMRADAQRQEGLMQPTVAQEAVSAAGVPQQGIAQVAQSLAPQTDMTQNTGVPNVQAAGLPGQPNQPQRMANGGILRLAPGGGLSGGTISAIASLKVNRPDIYEEYKDDPEALAMVAEYFNFPATDSERTGLESIEAPYVDPYGPQGLAQRTAAAEVGNQARLASDAAKQAETARMLGINAPIGSGRQGAPLDAAARRRIAEEDMAMAVPVPRDDFRTFPVDAPLTRDEKILADARAAIEKYGTNAGRDAEGNLLPVAPEQPFDYGARRDAAGNLLPVAPDYELTEAIEQRKRDEADEFFFNAGMFDRAAPENVAAQPRRSELAAELSAISAAEDLRQRIAQEDAAMAMPIPQGDAAAATSPRTQTAADIANETALRNREMASENAGRLTAEELMSPDATSATSGRPRAQGIASFGVFDPIVDRFKEIRSEDAARNAAAAEGDLGAFLGVGSANDPKLFDLPGAESFSEALNKYRVPSPEVQSANDQEEIARINEEIAAAEAAGNSNLVTTLGARRKQLLTRQRAGELATDTGEFLYSDVPNFVREQYNRRVAPFITSPQEAAVNLDTLAAERVEAEAAERQREARIKFLEGGATPTVMDAAEAAQEEFSQRPGTQDVKPAAEQEKIAAAMKTVTDPAAMPPAIKPGTGGTGKKSGIAAEKSKMDQDKWLALAQAGFTLMSTGDFGKAGAAGLAALRESNKDAREERKLEAELVLREAQLAKANRAPAAKAIPAAYLTDLRKQMEDKQKQLASLRPPEEGGFWSSGSDPDAATRTLLADQIRDIQDQIDFMYRSRGLPTVPNTATRTKV